MNDIEKIRILSRGLKAALRWPYTGEMLDHIKNPTLMEGHNYDPRYIADMREIKAALAAAEGK